jgi:hypothetical protein
MMEKNIFFALSCYGNIKVILGFANGKTKGKANAVTDRGGP